MKFSEVLASLTAPFKTLPQATAALEPAKATLDSVSALFTAAGLNLEQMLAAGPDALKAHLTSLDHSADVTRLQGELTTAQTGLEAANGKLKVFSDRCGAFAACFEAVGLAEGTKIDPAAFKTAFETHVSKQTTLALAKTGHPPAHVPAGVETTTAAKTGAELHAQWKAMKPSAERLAFFSKHEAEITAFERNAPAA